MALLAESLVEEWLNRQGFFTIRGVKHGHGEVDLPAVSLQPNGSIAGRHVEVQVSFRPIGYIGKRTEDMIAASGGGRNSAKIRTSEEISICARQWVMSKFKESDKVLLRERLWPGIDWSHHLVHGIVCEPQELEIFKAEGVECHPLHELLTYLSNRSKDSFSGSAGGDLAEIISYFKSYGIDSHT